MIDLPYRAKDLTGRKFGRLVAKSPVRNLEREAIIWRCECECGNEVECRSNQLSAGNVKSCGCLHREISSAVGSRVNLKHGHSRVNKKTPEYKTWERMKRRCFNPRHDGYSYYGGRGITVCDRWATSYQSFLDDMGPKPHPDSEIDRIDGNGNYEPGNCRWVRGLEQARNKESLILLTAYGQTMCVSDWAMRVGVKTSLIYARLKRGWSHERVVSEPLRR